MTEKCGCYFYNHAPKTHDLVLGIESMLGIDSARLLVALMEGGEIPGFAVEDEDGLLGAETFETFVAQHNWQDPVAMYFLAADSADAFEAQRKIRRRRDNVRLFGRHGIILTP